MNEIKEFFMWLVNTGTNKMIWDFVTNNAILLSAVAAITPWTWDNRLLDMIKGKKK